MVDISAGVDSHYSINLATGCYVTTPGCKASYDSSSSPSTHTGAVTPDGPIASRLPHPSKHSFSPSVGADFDRPCLVKAAAVHDNIAAVGIEKAQTDKVVPAKASLRLLDARSTCASWHSNGEQQALASCPGHLLLADGIQDQQEASLMLNAMLCPNLQQTLPQRIASLSQAGLLHAHGCRAVEPAMYHGLR